MRRHRTLNDGPGDYWKFQWLRWPSSCVAVEDRTWKDLLGHDYPRPDPTFVVHDEFGESPEITSPLEVPGLYREFARIQSLEEALAFVRSHGLLGLIEHHEPHKRFHSPLEESARHWLEELSRMKVAVEVWDLVQAKDIKSLKQKISVTEDFAFLKPWPGGRIIAQRGARNCAWLQRWRHGDVLGPARLFLIEEVNLMLAGKTSAQLLLNRDGTVQPHNAPVSLLAAIWLQFSEIVSGKRIERRCEICNKELDATENRKHKRMHSVCSQRVRMSKYRSKGKQEEKE
jgi:hypothetical protein